MTPHQIFWAVAGFAVLAFAIAHATATAVHARRLALRTLDELQVIRERIADLVASRPTDARVRQIVTAELKPAIDGHNTLVMQTRTLSDALDTLAGDVQAIKARRPCGQCECKADVAALNQQVAELCDRRELAREALAGAFRHAACAVQYGDCLEAYEVTPANCVTAPES